MYLFVKKSLLSFIIFCAYPLTASTQEIHFGDTIKTYNLQRYKTELRAYKTFQIFGAAGICLGGVGYSISHQYQWKKYSEMNGISGILNLTNYTFLLTKLNKSKRLDFKQSYKKFLACKRFYLISESFDLVLISAGFLFLQNAQNSPINRETNLGFGRALVTQGAIRITLDNIFYVSHARRNNDWYNIMDDIRIANEH